MRRCMGVLCNKILSGTKAADIALSDANQNPTACESEARALSPLRILLCISF